MHVQYEKVNSWIVHVCHLKMECKQSGQLNEVDVIANSYPLFRSLMAVEKKELFSLLVLDLTLLYLWPEGRSVSSPCSGWLESLRMEETLLWTLQW